MKRRPSAIGLMLCEQVIVEENTKNVTLVNCFSFRAVHQLPSVPVPFVLFSVLTGGAGEIPLEVVIARLDTFDEVYQRSEFFRFADPLREVRLTWRIRHCSFPVAGEYLATLLADGEPIGQRKFKILLREGSS